MTSKHLVIDEVRDAGRFSYHRDSDSCAVRQQRVSRAGIEAARSKKPRSSHHVDQLRARTDDEARRLLAEASGYASAKLSEVEARSHYLHNLHGQP